MLEYHVPVTAGGVANIFDLLETNKTALNITNFLVSQTTLEEVRYTMSHFNYYASCLFLFNDIQFILIEAISNLAPEKFSKEPNLFLTAFLILKNI
jgi:hypothetical protein